MKVKYPKNEFLDHSGFEVVVKCPNCGHGGTFDTISNCLDKLTRDAAILSTFS